MHSQPHRIRPETHWLREEVKLGRKGPAGEAGEGELWFSLQLTPNRATELYDALKQSKDPVSGNPFNDLIKAGAMMAPSSHTALNFALKTKWTDTDWGTVGTDILVPPGAFGELERLAGEETLAKTGTIEITDAGLAIPTDREATQPPLTLAGPLSVAKEEIRSAGPIIIAIIDDGIGIANHRFRKEQNETRIEHLLDLALVDGGKPIGLSKDELLGRSWTAKDINDLLDVSEDEEWVYRILGLIDPTRLVRQPLRAAVSHGTHMLDTAAGYDWRNAEAGSHEERNKLHTRPIIAVQLPAQVAENRSDAWMPQSLKRALDWILVKADELSCKLNPPGPGQMATRLPLIVNGSFASMAGSQDGCSDVERRIRQFVELYRGFNTDEGMCNVVLSAGNSQELRAAARIKVGPGGTACLPWRVQPDDKTASFVQVWLPRVNDPAPEQQVEVSLEPPRGMPPSSPSKLDGEIVNWEPGGRVRARLYHQRRPRAAEPYNAEKGSRECVTIAIGPTENDGASGPLVPSGLWRIKVASKPALTQEIEINLRVHRDDVGMFARSGARQAYFDHPGYQPIDPVTGRPTLYESPVTAQGTLNAYGYGRGTVLVAGYRNRDQTPAPYSSSGAAETWRNNGEDARGPDIAAVCEESAVLPGVLGSGTVSGSVAILNGTSVAAPFVTRALADILAPGKVKTLKEAAKAERLRPGRTEAQQDAELRLGNGLLLPLPSVRSRAGPEAPLRPPAEAAADPSVVKR